MLDECWKDGAKQYIKADPKFKEIPGFEERRFVPPKRTYSIWLHLTMTGPFRRMRYEEAIEWLAAHNVKNKEDKPHVFGMDIEEGTPPPPRFLMPTLSC